MFIEFVQEQIFLFIALAVIVAMLVYSYVGDKVSGYENVTADEAVRAYNGGAWVLDVRTDSEYRSGFIGEAEHLSSTEVAKKMDSLLSHKDEEVLVYCQSGMRSGSVAKLLVKNGFTRVKNLKGGVAAWQAAGLPLNKPVSKKKLKKERK